MSKVIVNISMSLDGFVAGDDPGPDNPLGENGLRLHDWIFGRKTPTDDRLMGGFVDSCGAVIVGWRTYAEAIHGAWGGENPFAMPAVVSCHPDPHAGDVAASGFTMVSGGIEETLSTARALAGGKNVWVMGGARTIQCILKAQLADELAVHVAPLLLMSGKRLFEHIGNRMIELAAEETVQTPGATHVRYRILKS